MASRRKYHSLSEKLFIGEIIQDDNNNDIERRKIDNSTEVSSSSIGFLHPDAKLIPYGRQDPIDENYISLTHPNVIDKTMLRKQNDLFSKQKDIERNYDDKCSNIFLFMPHEFRHNGHGSQCEFVYISMLIFCSHDMLTTHMICSKFCDITLLVNNYILATMIATYTNRAMVILEPPSQIISKAIVNLAVQRKHGHIYIKQLPCLTLTKY